MTFQFKKQVCMNTKIVADITEALASHMNAKGLAFVEATENDLYSLEPELGSPVVNGEPRWLITFMNSKPMDSFFTNPFSGGLMPIQFHHFL